MTEKHIWENGETITADLLNAMSDYADEKVDAIPKIDPTTLVKTTALASDTNLLAGTSDEWHTWTGDALTNSGWLNLANDLTMGPFLTVVPGTELSYAAEISPSIDGQIVMSFYTEDEAAGKEFFSNVVKAGTSGIAEVTCVVPENMPKAYFRMIRAATHQTESKQVTWRWRREKLNVGPYATPYSLPPVTDVGGQKPTNGHINMDAYALKDGTSPLTVNGKPVAMQSDIGTLNNKITALKAQISGGGVNLLDVTNGEFGNLSGNDGSLLDGFKNLYRTPNMIPVSDDATYLLNIATPGDEKPVIEKVCFYDANGNFTRKSFAQATRFGFTPQNGECFIRLTLISAQSVPEFPADVSWTKYGVTLTVTNSLETRLVALESKINGGTTA